MAQGLVEIGAVLFGDLHDPLRRNSPLDKHRTAIHIANDPLRHHTRIKTGVAPAICGKNPRSNPANIRNVAICDIPGPNKCDWFLNVNNLGEFPQFLPFLRNAATKWPRNDTLLCTESVSFRLARRGKQKAE